MYIFGVDVPLVELFLIITVVIGLFFVLFIYLLQKVMQINKKLDVFAKEEQKDLYMMEDVIGNLNEFEAQEGAHLKQLSQILGIVGKTKMPEKAKAEIKSTITQQKDERSRLLEERQKLKKKISDYYKRIRQQKP